MGSSMSGLSHRECTQKFDMNQPSTIPSAYRAALPTIDSTQYKRLMWVLNEIYVPARNSSDTQKAAEYRNRLLLSAGIDPANCYLTDDDIDVVQQLAIWYFANNINANYRSLYWSIATNPQANVWLNSIRDFVALGDQGNVGEWREEDAETLYQYFLTGAETYGTNYVYNTGSTQIPVSMDKSRIGVQTVGNNYVVGPYRISKVRDAVYSLSAEVSTNKGKITPEIVVKNGNNYVNENKNIREYIENGTDFYLRFPVDNTINHYI